MAATLIFLMEFSIAWISGRGSISRLGPLLVSGVEIVPEPIAQEIEAEYGNHDYQAREHDLVGTEFHELASLAEIRAPAWVRRLDAEPQEGEGGFGEQRRGQQKRGFDQDRPGNIGQDVTSQDPG